MAHVLGDLNSNGERCNVLVGGSNDRSRSVVICARCKQDKPLCYRVKSDLLDDLVCAECAEAARKVDLWVEKIDEEANRKNPL